MINKGLLATVFATLLLAGCVTEQGTPPVIDAGSRLPGSTLPPRSSQTTPPAAQSRPPTPALPAREPLPPATVETFPAPANGDGFTRGVPAIGGQDNSTDEAINSSNTPVPPASVPSGIPAGVLAYEETLDGPLLALLSTAREQQGSGNLSGAAASLERAQRIAPREPQVLYRLAEVRLAQGDAEQAEQIAQRALSYAGSRPPLQAGLWDLIARAREQRGDLSGAAQARAMARVNL